jgi:uracil-DNA glycosylase
LPGVTQLFNAFSLPVDQVKIILLGESPYPRAESANGYAFWDNAVDQLWSHKGFSKPVNRATSLRNFMKMLLVAGGYLQDDVSQVAIAALQKQAFRQTATQLFQGMLDQGFLLLNASLVYRAGEVKLHATHWLPFLRSILVQVARLRPQVQVLAFGRIAQQLTHDCPLQVLQAEHPYNISFIHNPAVLSVFKPLELLI